ncbi:MAG: ChaN family lipoprotein [Bacteroidia bacterium]|nr:ChaN family lipoprotein [Bacteroidia bacterium]MDW8016139.1 ChaN family lipoprotein [Bacteroidia bacterium]
MWRWAIVLGWVWAQDKPAYLLYSGEGKRLSYKQALSYLSKADVVLFGELHDDPIAHWLAYELVRDLYRLRGERLMVGMEMFETDQNEALQQYWRGEISLAQLGGKIRLWPNFSTDYAPLVEFARQAKIPLYATNAPRAFARAVAQRGVAAMEEWMETERQWVAPLPFPRLDSLPSYQQMSSMAVEHGIDPDNFRLAQMLRDATMAHRITSAWRSGVLFFHLNGRYHSDSKEGIGAYLRLYQPHLRVITLTTERVPEIHTYRPPKKGLADIILVVPETMTRTH